MRPVPTEILQAIFLACVESDACPVHPWSDNPVLPDLRLLYPDMRRSPLLLTRVCSTWRTVAFTTPALWCTLKVTLCSWTPVIEPYVCRLQSWFMRSADLPLHIEVTPCNYHGFYHEHMDQYVFPVLAEQAHRWHSLVLSGGPETRGFLQNLPLPNLQMLSVTTSDSDRDHRGRRQISITPASLANASKLYSLAIDIVDPAFVTRAQLGGRLRRLSLTYCPSLANVLEVMSLLPELVFIYIGHPPPNDASVGRHLTHAKLQTLEISCSTPWPALLNWLTLPALRRLAMRGFAWTDMLPAVLQMLQRSVSKVEDIEIIDLVRLVRVADAQKVAEAFLPRTSRLRLCQYEWIAQGDESDRLKGSNSSGLRA
ncbi:hypothetical protein HYDPIDRAFT_111334 [Hydnomerulius pinastri MD-312]|uniref:F-box domain-containing protein n=1 Tax=Hydnomerulius pinastri MD-312 TaxID=994086 RepID=A0A0C9WFE6_9AGAM|nr:hypothetical protein HYDPIDRAFT_111334 [Hydnomerulius pinastri MD-312]